MTGRHDPLHRRRAVTSIPPGETPRALVVDDDRALRETLVEVVSGLGVEAVAAGGGEEAVEVALSIGVTHIHLGLLDLHLPDISGLQVVRRLRRAGALLPFILISGDLDDGWKEASREEGAWDCLEKPLRLTELTRSVDSLLRELVPDRA